MLNVVAALSTAIPEVALFAALAIGYGIGQIKFGRIQWGRICSTLIAASTIGQFIFMRSAIRNAAGNSTPLSGHAVICEVFNVMPALAGR